MKKIMQLFIFIGIIAFYISASHAEDRWWKGSIDRLDPDGDSPSITGDNIRWMDPYNWDPTQINLDPPHNHWVYTLPQDDDNVWITQPYADQNNVYYSNPDYIDDMDPANNVYSDNTRLTNLYIENEMVLNIDSTHTAWDNGPAHGFWVLNNEYIGQTSLGAVNQNDGIHTVWGGWDNTEYHAGTGNLLLGAGEGYEFGGLDQYGRVTYVEPEVYGNGSYHLNGGTLEAYWQTIGGTDGADWQAYDDGAGEGHFTQEAGTINHAGGLFLGGTPFSYGSYVMNGGTLNVDSWETVGGRGDGDFVQNGGTHAVGLVGGGGAMVIGATNLGKGTYTLNSGDLIVHTTGNTDNFYAGFIIGEMGEGTFTQNGGSVQVDANLLLGLQPEHPDVAPRTSEGKGTYEMNYGTLSVGDDFYVGGRGKGRFIQTGGTVNVGTNPAYNTALWINDLTGSGSVDPANLNSIADLDGVGYGRYDLTGSGVLNSESEKIGGNYPYDTAGLGVFTQTAGTVNTANGLHLGETEGSTGIYFMEGGELHAGIYTSPDLYDNELIGLRGTGYFYQLNGLNRAERNVNIGVVLPNPDSSIPVGCEGTYHLRGGTLDIARNLVLGYSQGAQGYFYMDQLESTVPVLLTVTGSAIVGNLGSGELHQNAGTVNITGNMNLAAGSGTIGTYDLVEGGLSVGGNSIISTQGTAYFNQFGGTHHVAGDMNLSQNSAGTATYYMNGGDLQVDDSLNVGHDGKGTVTLDAGTSSVNVGYHIVLGNNPTGDGTINQHAGTVTVGTPGSQTLDNSVLVQMASGSTGTYNLTGGTLNAHSVLNSGNFNFRGGNLQANVYNGSTGTVTMQANNPADTLKVQNSSTNDGLWKIMDSTVAFGGPMANRTGATMQVANSTAAFGGVVTNETGATMHITNSAVTFEQGITNNGALISDPSTIDFIGDAIIGANGYLVGGANDVFNMHAGLLSSSTNPLWNTREATLAFIGSGVHQLLLNSTNTNSLHWNTLLLDTGAGIDFSGGAGTLFVDNIVVGDLAQLNGISPNLHVFYQDILKPDGEKYDLTGWIAPNNITVTPEPASMLLFGLGGGVLALFRRKKD